jgi:hypothetical protein
MSLSDETLAKLGAMQGAPLGSGVANAKPKRRIEAIDERLSDVRNTLNSSASRIEGALSELGTPCLTGQISGSIKEAGPAASSRLGKMECLVDELETIARRFADLANQVESL